MRALPETQTVAVHDAPCVPCECSLRAQMHLPAQHEQWAAELASKGTSGADPIEVSSTNASKSRLMRMKRFKRIGRLVACN